MLMASEPRGSARLGCASLLCLAIALIMSQEAHESGAVALHSEWSLEDEHDSYYSKIDQEEESVFWLVHEARMLKRGGSSGGGWSSSRSRNSSYGNCYGERCDNIGGDSESAVIVGSVIGGCCFILLCYMLVKWI